MKKIQKLLSFLVCLACVALAFTLAPAALAEEAEATAKIHFEYAGTTVNRGDVIEVSVYLEDCVPVRLGAVEMQLGEGVRVAKGTWENLDEDLLVIETFQGSNGAFIYRTFVDDDYDEEPDDADGDGVADIPVYPSPNGQILTLRLKITDSAPLGETIITLEPGFDNADGERVDIEVEPLVLNITCPHKNQTTYDAVAPDCINTGLTAGTKCDDCGEVLVAQEVVDALGHDEVIDAAVEPTCTETGLTEGKHCSVCGETLVAQEVVAALGHEEVIDAAVEPTCTETGLTEGKHCARCGEVLIAQEVVAALGHEEVIDAAVAPSCSESGLTEGKHCARCEAVLVAQEIVLPTGEHNFVETDRQEATCTEDGYVNYACGCGTAFDTEVLPMTGHSHEAAVTAPTCTEQGYTTYTCHCGDEYVDDYVDALGHTEVTTEENRVEPTCAVDGSYVQVVTCSVCGEELSRETIVIPATGEHIYAEPGERVEPTCTEDGYYIMICGCGAEERTELPALGHEWVAANCTTPKTCSVCGATEGEPVPEAHDYGEWEIIVEAGNEEGLMRRWCAVCGGFDELVIPPNHTCSFRKLVIAPTCDSWGVDLYICTGCELSYTDNYKPALGHTFGEYVSNNDATCTEDGTKTAKCVRCDATDTIADEGSAKGHGSFSVKFNSWPTCTEDADWDVFCEACGIQIADEEWQSWGTINGWKATGHKWADATCTTPKTCTVCGETEGEMLAHTEEIIPGKAATCTEAGLTEGKKCSVCGEILVAQEEIAVLEHTEEIIPGKAATCTETGLTEGKKCSVCGEILVAQEEIAVLEHAGEWVIVKEAQIGEAGLKQLICTVCGEVIAEEEIPALEEPAPTSDSMILLFVISAMAAMTGAAVLVMKKKYF